MNSVVGTDVRFRFGNLCELLGVAVLVFCGEGKGVFIGCRKRKREG